VAPVMLAGASQQLCSVGTAHQVAYIIMPVCACCAGPPRVPALTTMRMTTWGCVPPHVGVGQGVACSEACARWRAVGRTSQICETTTNATR
jgi:hypothetical protein